jgi:hypothetical protein
MFYFLPPLVGRMVNGDLDGTLIQSQGPATVAIWLLRLFVLTGNLSKVSSARPFRKSHRYT